MNQGINGKLIILDTNLENNMKAIVLTYDKNAHFAELVYKMYMKLWPDCPFIFQIPWNKHKRSYFEHKPNINLIHCPQSIQSTVQSLLKSCDDEEWVYWCIDDHCPIKMDTLRLNNILSHLHLLKDYDFVRLNYPRDTQKFPNPKPLIPIKLIKNEPTFLQCHSYHLGFWNHHFIKVKILKYVFSSDFSDISCFNKLIRDDNILYFARGIFPKTTPRQSIETMIDGLPTELGLKYLNNMNVSIT